MQVYVAASFAYADRAKTEERKRQIEEIVDKVKAKLDGEYYLPHQLTIPNAWDMSLEEWSYRVYEEDLSFLNDTDVVLFLSFGKENNAGAVWEVGYVAGQNCVHSYSTIAYYHKNIICIKMTDDPESLMVTQSVDAIITREEIETYDWHQMPRYKTQLSKIS